VKLRCHRKSTLRYGRSASCYTITISSSDSSTSISEVVTLYSLAWSYSTKTSITSRRPCVCASQSWSPPKFHSFRPSFV